MFLSQYRKTANYSRLLLRFAVRYTHIAYPFKRDFCRNFMIVSFQWVFHLCFCTLVVPVLPVMPGMRSILECCASLTAQALYVPTIMQSIDSIIGLYASIHST